MPKKRLAQYSGRLTSAQIAEGMNAAVANAKRLADAAKVLLEKGDYALAASVAALAIEESGKESILRGLSVARPNEEVTQCWRDYRSHTKKNSMWLFLQLVGEGARRLDDFGSLFADQAEHTFLLDQVKQLGFYTDCIGKAHWSVPAKVISKDLATALVEVATLLARPRQVKTAEVELWRKHVGPVWKGPKELMEHALVEWYRDMQEQGLAESGPNPMEQFIMRGLGPNTGSGTGVRGDEEGT